MHTENLHVMIFLGGKIISENVLILQGLISSTVFCMQLMNLAVNELHWESIKTRLEGVSWEPWLLYDGIVEAKLPCWAITILQFPQIEA